MVVFVYWLPGVVCFGLPSAQAGEVFSHLAGAFMQNSIEDGELSLSLCVCESAEADFGPLDVLYGARPYIGLGSLTESNLNPFYSC